MRRDDEVMVIAARIAARRGGPARGARQRARLRRGPEHRQAPPAPDGPRPTTAQAASSRREGPIHISNVALVGPEGRQADALGVEERENGKRFRVAQSLRTRLIERWPPTAPPTRTAEDALRRGDPPRAAEAASAIHDHAGAQDREDHAQHGRGRGQAGLQDAGGRPGAARDDRRPEARTSAARASRSRPSSCARACPSACRHPARRPRLRVPRPADLDRDPAHPRLPRP